MAEINKTIDPDDVGADYASIAAWDAGEQTDLTIDEDTHVVTLSNISDSADNSAPVNLSYGWLVDDVFYITMTVNPDYRHDGTRNTGYRYIPSTELKHTLELIAFTHIDGLAVSTSAINSWNGIYEQDDGYAVITNCLVYDMGNNGIAAQSGIFCNCIVVGCGNIGMIIESDHGYFGNCISIANDVGYRNDGSDLYLKNCYAGGNSSGDYIVGDGDNTYCYNCMAADTSFADNVFQVESNCSDGITYDTTNLLNVTGGSEDPKLPSGSDLIDAGIDIDGDAEWPLECEYAGDGTDFEGTVRGVTWDVGAHCLVTEYLVGSSVGQSTVEGALTRFDTQLVGDVSVQSTIEGLIKSIKELVGSLLVQSTVEGALTRFDTQLVGSLLVQSTVEGSLKEWNNFIGSLDAQSTAEGILTRFDTQLIGTLDVQATIDAILHGWDDLIGSLDGQSAVYSKLYVIGFYEGLTNKITSHFKTLANINNFIVRYDSDPRPTPISGAWMKAGINYGNERITGIGKGTPFQVAGVFNVQIKTPIEIGTADALDIADIIAAGFRTIIIEGISTIKFQVPSIQRVGRVEDNYQFDVLCPFKVDKE